MMKYLINAHYAAVPQFHKSRCIVGNVSRLLLELFFRKSTSPLTVGISGDGALGKTTLAYSIASVIDGAIVIETDGFILDRSTRQVMGISGDDPRALDVERLRECLLSLSALSSPNQLRLGKYNHRTGKVEDCLINASAGDIKIVIVEGSFALYFPIRPFIDFGIFLDASYNTRYNLRMKTDIQERGYSLSEFTNNWVTYTQFYEEVILPCRTTAQLILLVTCNYQYGCVNHLDFDFQCLCDRF